MGVGDLEMETVSEKEGVLLLKTRTRPTNFAKDTGQACDTAEGLLNLLYPPLPVLFQ